MISKQIDYFQAREYFCPINIPEIPLLILEAEKLDQILMIPKHPFFSAAKINPKALEFWVTQEAVVTNPFSQILFKVIARIDNVHIRSTLMPVVVGEHSIVRQGVATGSHPWLIWKLCNSIGLDYEDIVPSNAVKNFLETLESTIDNPMKALGALGIGNERILILEYRAIEECFDNLFPDADYKGFLHANILEDESHSVLIAQAATALTLISSKYKEQDFLEGARIGVNARIDYYDKLFENIINL